MYREVLGYADRLAVYIDGQGRKDQASLPSGDRWHYAAAGMRATNRTLALANAYIGAQNGSHTDGLLISEPATEQRPERLPPPLAALLAELDRLEVRTWRLFNVPAGLQAGSSQDNSKIHQLTQRTK